MRLRSRIKRLALDLYWEAVALGRNVPRNRPARQAREVLFVCLGNVCRSPMAEALAAPLAGEMGLADVRFRSAGFKVEKSIPATPEAVQVMAEAGHDLSAHRSRPLTAEALEAADLVVVMEAWQAQALGKRYPTAREKIVLLPELSPNPPRGRARFNIGDPYGQGC